MKMNNILYARHSGGIVGEIKVSSDKSMSHRAIILACLARGRSTISNLLDSQDVMNNANVFRNLGVSIKVIDGNDGIYEIISEGIHSFRYSGSRDLYMGNSGTACRLITGALAGSSGEYIISGDFSLKKRPMQRIIDPLRQMGALIEASDGGVLPMRIKGAELKAIDCHMEVASAQVKSAILLAGLFAQGKTRVFEKIRTRDHSENMLKALGVRLSVFEEKDGIEIVLDNEKEEIKGYSYDIPSDFSSASFFIGMGLINEGSNIIIKDVNLNPLRIGFLRVLEQMGANIQVHKKDEKILGEDIGDIYVRSSLLRGVLVEKNMVASMIDEFPILAVVASFAEGKTVFNGIEELRVKESDRIKSIALNLLKLGVKVEEEKESLVIHGGNVILEGGEMLESFYDHRIAMSLLVMGTRCKKEIGVDRCDSIMTSFPKFKDICLDLGINIR